MSSTARSSSGLRARTGWTKARWRRQWAQTAAAALAVDCYGVDGTTGSGLGSLRRAVESRARVQGGQSTALKWLTAGALSRASQARMQGTRGLKGVCSECMEMYGPPPLFL